MRQGSGIVLGLTGGIASGKSTAAETVARLGAVVLDADRISRDATKAGSDCFTRIVDTFGCQVLDDDGTISRKALAAIAFSDAAQRQALNDIIHPFVLTQLQQRTYDTFSAGETVVVWDVPLLLEVGWQRYVDGVILVVAEEKTRIKRIMRRDGCTEEDARRRMAAQLPDTAKYLEANFIISNQSSEERFRERVSQIYQRICCGAKEG